MEKLLEDVSFNNPKEEVVIDAKYVNEHLKDIAMQEDLARYIL